MDWIIPIVNAVLGNLTPELRKAICAGLKQWEATAKTTASPWDDIFVKLAQGIMKCE